MLVPFVVALVQGSAPAQTDAAREAVFEFEARAELVAVDVRPPLRRWRALARRLISVLGLIHQRGPAWRDIVI